MWCGLENAKGDESTQNILTYTFKIFTNYSYLRNIIIRQSQYHRCPYSERGGILFSYLLHTRTNPYRPFLPALVCKNNTQIIKVGRHYRIARWNCPVIYFFLPYDDICLTFGGKIEITGFFFTKLIDHKFRQFPGLYQVICIT